MSDEAERLNLRAFFALRGASNTPERDLADLLRSDHPIDPEVRRMLADALAGRPQTDENDEPIAIVLRANTTAIGRKHRSIDKLRDSLIRGKKAKALTSAGETYEDALNKVAKDHAVDSKTVGRDYTLAGKAASWVQRQSNHLPLAEWGVPMADGVSFIEQFYIRALWEKVDPTDRFEAFISALEDTEQRRKELISRA